MKMSETGNRQHNTSSGSSGMTPFVEVGCISMMKMYGFVNEEDISQHLTKLASDGYQQMNWKFEIEIDLLSNCASNRHFLFSD